MRKISYFLKNNTWLQGIVAILPMSLTLLFIFLLLSDISTNVSIASKNQLVMSSGTSVMKVDDYAIDGSYAEMKGGTGEKIRVQDVEMTIAFGDSDGDAYYSKDANMLIQIVGWNYYFQLLMQSKVLYVFATCLVVLMFLSVCRRQGGYGCLSSRRVFILYVVVTVLLILAVFLGCIPFL